MKNVLALFWLVIIVAFPVRVFWTHGGKWEFGPHGIPMIALSPDGKTYRDGDELDPLTAAITRSGKEETIVGCTLGGLIAFFAWSACEHRREKHAQNIKAQHRQSEALLALAQRYQQEGAAGRGGEGICLLPAIARGRNGPLAQQEIDAADDGASPEDELRTAGNRGTERRWGDDSDRES